MLESYDVDMREGEPVLSLAGCYRQERWPYLSPWQRRGPGPVGAMKERVGGMKNRANTQSHTRDLSRATANLIHLATSGAHEGTGPAEPKLQDYTG